MRSSLVEWDDKFIDPIMREKLAGGLPMAALVRACELSQLAPVSTFERLQHRRNKAMFSDTQKDAEAARAFIERMLHDEKRSSSRTKD